MYNYNVFKELFIRKVTDYMPGEFSEENMVVSNLKMPNYIDGRDTISFRRAGSNIAPVMYFDNLYDNYRQDGDMRRVLTEFAETYVAAFDRKEPVYENAMSLNKQSILENVVFNVINKDLNHELLENMVSRDFNDLAIVYRVVLAANSKETASILVKNEFAKTYNISEEELYSAARTNTKNILGFRTTDICEIVPMPDELKMSPETSMYIMTTASGSNGACAMLYEDELEKLSDKLNSDLYIIPSSVHEIIAVSAEYYDEPDELADMVRTVNSTEVAIKDRLSNQVYMYSHKDKCVSIATHADKSLIYAADKPDRDEVLKRPFVSK